MGDGPDDTRNLILSVFPSAPSRPFAMMSEVDIFPQFQGPKSPYHGGPVPQSRRRQGYMPPATPRLIGYRSPYTRAVLYAESPYFGLEMTHAQLLTTAKKWSTSPSGHGIGSHKKRAKRLATVQQLQRLGQSCRSSTGPSQSDRGLISDLFDSIGGSFESMVNSVFGNLLGHPAAPPAFPAGPLVPFAPISGNRKALLVGINYVGQQGQLRGCVNDAKSMARYLKEQGFSTMRLLVDEGADSGDQPTKANIIQGMRWLVQGARPGDSLFFHYSGHGSTQRDTSGDERDNQDETICPLDYKRAGMLVDDEICDLLVEPLSAGVRLTCLMDCCHSGTGMDLPYVMSSKKDEVVCEYKSNLNGDVVLFSGCRDDQTSADAVVDDVGFGAMTNAMLKSLHTNPKQSYQQLLQTIRRHLRAGYTQVPQLSMSKNLNLATPFQV
eukprot:NODE_189_length_1669_cov_858.618519_g128_i0.p1 GENE.NODE_189_length_1669_cov_858.618519_g128_i0~~NODE_189_length_1669_cov_858.618519_g128_i0.p1  ORF type:complete len:448 (-),score=151.78 NODE_189_length_1669_cov_858.618519_g128_i0:324-1637(-)